MVGRDRDADVMFFEHGKQERVSHDGKTGAIVEIQLEGQRHGPRNKSPKVGEDEPKNHDATKAFDDGSESQVLELELLKLLCTCDRIIVGHLG